MAKHLRPLERCILRMRDEGVAVDEIGRRLRRSPQQIARIIEWTRIPRSHAPRRSAKALERRVLALRAAGETHEEIGSRFRRSGRFIRQVEGLAHFRLAYELLG